MRPAHRRRWQRGENDPETNQAIRHVKWVLSGDRAPRQHSGYGGRAPKRRLRSRIRRTWWPTVQTDSGSGKVTHVAYAPTARCRQHDGHVAAPPHNRATGGVSAKDPAGRAGGVAQLNWSAHPTAVPGRGGGGGFIGTWTGGASGQGYVFDRPSKQNRATPDWRAVIIRVARAGRGGAAFFGPKQTQVTAELGIKSGSKSDLAGYSASQDVRPGACQHRDVSSLAGRSAPARKVTQIILSNSAHQPRSLDRRQERTR